MAKAAAGGSTAGIELEHAQEVPRVPAMLQPVLQCVLPQGEVSNF